MKINYTNIYGRALSKNFTITRMKYLHAFLRVIDFTTQEVEDMLKLSYNADEYEFTEEYLWIFETIKPLLENHIQEYRERRSLTGSEKAEKFSEEDFLTKDEVFRDLTLIYRDKINKSELGKEEAKIALDVIKRIQDDFGLFDLEEIAQKKFYGHFYQVYKALNAVCPNPDCGHEIDIVRSVLCQCPFCGTWIDARETKKDIEDGRKMKAGVHGENNIEQIEGADNYKIQYPDHDFNKEE